MVRPDINGSPPKSPTISFEPDLLQQQETSDPIPQKSSTSTYTIDATHYLDGKEKQHVNVYYKFVHLIGFLLISDQVELVQFDDLSHPIREGPEIPQDEEKLKLYCKDAHVSRRKTLHYIFKLKCYNVKFYDLKTDIIPWLQKNNIYIHPTHLSTGYNCVIGWMLNTHTRLSHLISTAEDIKYHISSNLPFQLVPRMIRNDQSVTRALAIECGIKDASTLEALFFQHFSDNHDNFLVTKPLQYVPMNSTGDITKNLICQLITQQNIFLDTTRHIIISTSSDLYRNTWEYSEQKAGDEWRKRMAHAMSADNIPLFSIIDSGPKNKLFAFTTADHYHEANDWITTYKQQLTSLLPIDLADDSSLSYFDTNSRNPLSVTSTYAEILKRQLPPSAFINKLRSATIPPTVQRCKVVFSATETSDDHNTHPITMQHNENDIITPQRSNRSPPLSDVTDSQGNKTLRLQLQICELQKAMEHSNETIKQMQQ